MNGIDFDFYRRRAAFERLLARQAAVQTALRALMRLGQDAVARMRLRAADRTAPIRACCLAARRNVCCA